MIDILNNPSKNFKLKRPIKVWIYPLQELKEGTLLVPKSVELGSTSSTVTFGVSKENDLNAMAETMAKMLVEKSEKDNQKKKLLYERMIKIWEERPEIFKKQDRSYSETYKCSEKNLFTSDEYMLAFVTGCGSETYYSKKHFEDLLKHWDKICADEIKDIKKKTKSYVKDILKAEIEINSGQLNNFLTLEDSSNAEQSEQKPAFPFKFDPNSLNLLLSEMGGDFDVNDELIESLKEEDEELANQLQQINGAVFTTSHEGEHHNDGQICDYTVTILTVDNHEYSAYNSHCLMTGWNFHEPVEFK